MWIPLNGSPTFHLTVKDPTAGTVDASSTPTFEVYEDNSTTPMGISGSMTSVTTGRYYCKFNVDAANGFENTKVYNVHGIYTYGGVTRVEVLQTFRVVPAEAIAGVPLVDVYGYRFDPIPATTSSGVPDVTVIAMASGTIVNGTFATDAISGTKISTSAVTKIAAGVVVGGIIDCTAGGCVGIDWGNIENKTTSNAFTGTTIATTQQVDVNTIKTQTVTASGGVTFPAATLASTTNITAGTITTVTNLTNAPTNGDLTATMKASINTEADTALSDYGALKPTTAGRTLDVTATGAAGIDWGNIESATTGSPNVNVKSINSVDQVTPGASGGLLISGTNSGTTTLGALAVTGDIGAGTLTLAGLSSFERIAIGAAVTLDAGVSINGDLSVDGSVTMATLTNDIQGVTASVVGTGAITSGSFASGAITAAAIAADAIGASELAADAITEIQSGLATASSLSAVAGDVTSILADTSELQTDWVNGGRLDLILDARASQTSVDTIDGIVDAILVDTAEIGTAGAGLTNINLPNQTMDIVGSITGNLSGSVGSVTGGVTVTTNNDKTGYSITGTTTTLDDLQTALNSAHGSGSWATATGFATSSGLSAVDAKIDVIDGNVDLILEDTGTTIPATLAGLSTFDASSDSVTVGTNNDKTGYALTQTFPSNFASLGINASGHVSRVTLVDTTTVNTDMRGTNNAALATDLATVAGYLDTEIAAILADTNELQTDWADGGRLDLILDARASQSSVNTIDDLLDTEVAAIKAKTDQLTFTVANQVDANALTGGGGGSAPTAAENATAVWSAGTRTLSGTLGSFDAIWAKIKSWLGLLAGKTADTVTRAEINATTAGATYNETTDSLEAIADAQTAGTTIVYPFESRIMDRVSSTLIQAYEDESGWVIGPVTVVDASDNPVDLSVYDDLKFIVDTQAGLDVYTTTDVTVSGDDDNKWSVVGTDDITEAAPAELRWALRGIGTGVNVVLGYGVLRVTPAATEDPAP